jgi:hypothetical protein
VSIVASGLRKSTNGALPSSQPRLHAYAKPWFSGSRSIRMGRSETLSTLPSSESLSTRITVTPGRPVRGSRQARSVLSLLKETTTTSTASTA